MSWLITLPSCDSTNDEALARLADLAHGDCVFSAEQRRGRGRGGSRWHAPPGVFTASFVIDLAAPAHGPLIALAAGLALIDGLTALGLRAPFVCKWPNDVLVHEHKLAGILCEARDGRLVVGIGCNLDPDWSAADIDLQRDDPDALAPISCADLGEPPQPAALAEALRERLLASAERIAADGGASLIARLRERDALRDRHLRIRRAAGGELRGRGRGFDEHGRLLVAGDDGSLSAVDSGSVTILPSPDRPAVATPSAVSPTP